MFAGLLAQTAAYAVFAHEAIIDSVLDTLLLILVGI